MVLNFVEFKAVHVMDRLHLKRKEKLTNQRAPLDKRITSQFVNEPIQIQTSHIFVPSDGAPMAVGTDLLARISKVIWYVRLNEVVYDLTCQFVFQTLSQKKEFCRYLASSARVWFVAFLFDKPLHRPSSTIQR